MATNNLDLFSYLPGLEVTENELLESELAVQQILKAQYPTLDLREGTGLRDLTIRPNATMLGLINKALVQYFQNNTIAEVTDSTPQVFVDKLLSNWFLTRKIGAKAIINVRLYFAKAKTVALYTDVFFSTDGDLKFFPMISSSYDASQLTFDTNANQYYIDVDLIAEKAGIGYNITTGSLLYFSNFDPYFLHSEINYLREAAENVESNTEFITRAKTAISTRNNINVPSVQANLTDYFTTLKEVKTVGMGDPEMTRDMIKVVVPGVTDPIWLHNGGYGDIYCRTPVSSSIIQVQTNSVGKVILTGSIYHVDRSLISGGDNDDTLPLYVTKAVTSITRTAGVATVTCTAHGYTTGQVIHMSGATQSAYNGDFVITNTGANTFTYAVTGTPATPATGTITAGTPIPFTVVNSNLVTANITGITRVNTTATVTSLNHGLLSGERVTLSGAAQTAYNGTFVVTSVLTRDTFTYEVVGTPVTPATGTMTMTFVDRYNEIGFSDRQSLTIDFGNTHVNQTVSFIIYYHQNIDSIQSYLSNSSNRVISGDLLARGFNLTALDITITAYNGPAPDVQLANEVCIAYLAGIPIGEPFVMADLISALYEAGITTIKTPIGVAYTKYWKDWMNTTSGTITDALDPNDSLNLFLVNSVTTTNSNIV